MRIVALETKREMKRKVLHNAADLADKIMVGPFDQEEVVLEKAVEVVQMTSGC